MLSAEFQVVRAAVFYQEGFAPSQRRLLREVAMEVQVEAFKPKSAPASPEDNSLMYFSPETSRVRLPDELSAEIAAKVEAYQKEKSEIKTELRDAICQQDRATNAQRVQALRQLAESQTPRIAALEILAEDIRQGLALQPKQPGPPSPPSLPPELATRITAYQKEKIVLRKLLQDKLKELGKGLTPTKTGFSRTEAASGDDLHPDDVGPALLGKDRQKLMRDALAAFSQATADRFTALGKEKEAIRGELARLVSTPTETVAGKSADTLLKEFADAVQQQEAWQQYGDYQVAVFQPGLSPEQRRLLFDAAIENLALPLPGGERLH
jgi:aminopeptidase N